MYFVCGSGMYGKVDEIPGIGYIQTKFGHLYYLPLVPTSTYFVTEEFGVQILGSTLPLNAKSVLKTYLWAGLLVAAIVLTGFGVPMLADGEAFGAGGKVVLTIFILGSITATFFASRIWNKASYERACEIADQLNFEPQLKIFIDLQYDQISEQQADARLDELSSSLADLDDLSDELAASGLDQTITQN